MNAHWRENGKRECTKRITTHCKGEREVNVNTREEQRKRDYVGNVSGKKVENRIGTNNERWITWVRGKKLKRQECGERKWR